MAFKTGIDYAKDQAEKAKPKGDSEQLYISLKDGESVLLRPLHDGTALHGGTAWYSYMQHSYLPLREPSSEWPTRVQKFYLDKRMNATCQKDKNIGGDSCFICDELHLITPNEKTLKAKRVANRGRYFAQQRYMIPFVVRREVIATQEMIDNGEVPKTVKRNGRDVSNLNRVVAVVDATEEREVKIWDEEAQEGVGIGTRGQVPMIRLVEHPHDTSIAGLAAEYFDSEDKTVLDRDFKLTRQGEGLETKYLWTSRKQIKYRTDEGEELVWDLGDPSIFATYAPYIPNIEKMIRGRASDEYYAKYFDMRAPFFEYEDDEDDDAPQGGLHVVKDTNPDPDAEAKRDALAKAREEVIAGMLRPKSQV